MESGHEKFSKTVDSNTFFGFKDSVEARRDLARASSADQVNEVISFDLLKYHQIIRERQLTAGERKINFLLRFGPGMRHKGRTFVEETEFLWQKIHATQGYQFQKFGEVDDHLYLIYSGSVRVLTPMSAIFPGEEFDDEHQNVVFNTLKMGEFFGEQSAINDELHPWTMEVSSKSAIVLKIHRSMLYKSLGGSEGAAIDHLRSIITMKHRWDEMKYEHIRNLSKEDVLKLEFREEAHYSRLRQTATATRVKEVSYRSAQEA